MIKKRMIVALMIFILLSNVLEIISLASDNSFKTKRICSISENNCDENREVFIDLYKNVSSDDETVIEKEPNDTERMAQKVSVGKKYIGEIGSYEKFKEDGKEDVDYIKIPLRQGKTYRFHFDNYLEDFSNTTLVGTIGVVNWTKYMKDNNCNYYDYTAGGSNDKYVKLSSYVDYSNNGEHSYTIWVEDMTYTVSDNQLSEEELRKIKEYVSGFKKYIIENGDQKAYLKYNYDTKVDKEHKLFNNLQIFYSERSNTISFSYSISLIKLKKDYKQAILWTQDYKFKYDCNNNSIVDNQYNTSYNYSISGKVYMLEGRALLSLKDYCLEQELPVKMLNIAEFSDDKSEIEKVEKIWMAGSKLMMVDIEKYLKGIGFSLVGIGFENLYNQANLINSDLGTVVVKQKMDINNALVNSSGDTIRKYRVTVNGNKGSKYASVSSKGILTAKKAGVVDIEALNKKGKVVAKGVIKIVKPSFDVTKDKSLPILEREGQTLDMSEYLLVDSVPCKLINDNIIEWSIPKKSKIATIDQSTGVLRVLGKSGKVKVTAIFTNKQGKKAKIKINVKVKIRG